MRVRRRSVFLSAAFLGLAVFTAGPATAQPPPPRSNYDTAQSVPPEQIRAALLRLTGQGGDFPKDLSPFAEAVKKKVLSQNPGIDPTVLDNALRKIVNDPERMKQLRALAEKQAANGGKTPAADDIAKMFQNMPKDVPGLPKDIGKQLGRQFGQGIPTPAPDPSRPPPPLNPGGVTLQPRPNPTAPVPPPLEPDKLDTRPAPKKIDPARPPQNGETPKITPGDPPPPPPTANDGPPNVPDFRPPGAGENKPLNPFEQTPEDMARGKAMRALAGAWEKNIGPLSETPAVERALAELVTGVGDMKDADGKSIWDAFDKELGDGKGFADWLNGEGFGGDWKMPSFNFNMPSWNLGRTNIDVGGGSPSRRSSWWNRGPRGGSGGGSGGGGFGIPGLEGTWLPVVLLAAVLLGALVWWRFVYLRDPAREQVAFAGVSLGEWPIDPRRIATREDVVKAFEYLSVLICGPEAKTWTHATIAEALTGLARTHGEAAVMLARLYELARYAPMSEPLTPDELSEARRLVCALAGVANV